MLTCLACGHDGADLWAEASDEEYQTTPDKFRYVRCQRCHALFVDPVPRERLSTIYPSNYYSFDEKVTTSLPFRIKDKLDQRFFRSFIAPLPQKELRVLDVGGGVGTQLDSLRKVDPRIQKTAIVDLDEKAKDIAEKKGHSYFLGRFEDFPAEESFDIILMLNLIEHVENPKELLEKASRLLSPDGILLLKTPNTDSWDARLFRHKNWGGYHCPRHWVLFDRPSFESLLTGVPLQIRFFKYTQGAPFWTTSLLFALHRKGWIRISSERPAPKHPLYPLLNIFFAGLDFMRGPFAKTSQMLIVLEKAKPPKV